MTIQDAIAYLEQICGYTVLQRGTHWELWLNGLSAGPQKFDDDTLVQLAERLRAHHS